MTTSRIQTWYQNPKKHLILAQFSNSPWTGRSARRDRWPNHRWAVEIQAWLTYSTISSVCIPRWPRPHVWQQRNGYVPGVCAINSIVVVFLFLGGRHFSPKEKKIPGDRSILCHRDRWRF